MEGEKLFEKSTSIAAKNCQRVFSCCDVRYPVDVPIHLWDGILMLPCAHNVLTTLAFTWSVDLSSWNWEQEKGFWSRLTQFSLLLRIVLIWIERASNYSFKYVQHGACYIDKSVDVSYHWFSFRKMSSLVFVWPMVHSGYFGGHPWNLVDVAQFPKLDRELIVEVGFTVMGEENRYICSSEM